MIKISPFKWAAFNFFGFFCAYGVLLPFLPVWLKHHGYSTEMIALFASFGYLARFGGGMFFSQRVKQASQLISTVRFLTWANLGALLAMIFVVDLSVWLLFPVLMIFHLFNAGAMPIGESIASTWQRQIQLDYGKARLFGSLAFVVGSISTGYLVNQWLGETAIVWIMAAFLIMLGIGQLCEPAQKFVENEQNQTANHISYGQILRNPTHLRVLLAVSLIMASHAAYYTYSTLYWTSIGISTQTASLLWGLAVTAEVLFFLLSNRLFKAWKIHHLMIFSAVAALLRWTILASQTHLGWLALSQTLHALTFGMGHFAIIRYISAQPTEQIAKLQGLYFGLASCAVMAIFTVIAGFIYPTSPTASFWLMAVMVIPVAMIVPKLEIAKMK